MGSSAFTSRPTAALSGALGLSLALAACGGGGTTSDTAGGGASAAPASECAEYEQYGDLKGKTVTVYAGIVTPEDKPHVESYKPFEKCTGATVKYEADKAFEAQVLVRAKAGNPPDLALIPQPGLLGQLVATGKVVEAPEQVSKNTDEFWSPDFKKYGTVGGKFYAAPLGSSLKSLVWYSPAEFDEKGIEIPKTLDELRTVSDKLAEGDRKPWCAGIASGEATGWPITDWTEDMMLRLSGPETYDKWVNHEIPFDGPESTAALDEVGSFMKNEKYFNGGYGNLKSIAATTFQDGGLPILDGTCSLHRQASFYAANWPEGTKVAEDGEVFAFYLPGKTAEDKPVLGGGEFVAAFADRPEVAALQAYLSTDTWANNKAKSTPLGGWVSANKGLDKANLVSPLDKLAAETFSDDKAVFRFDGSDQMPAQIGSGAFWKQATAWITGQSTADTVAKIEDAWPKTK